MYVIRSFVGTTSTHCRSVPIMLSVHAFFVTARGTGSRYHSSHDLVFDTDAYPRSAINFRLTGANSWLASK